MAFAESLMEYIALCEFMKTVPEGCASWRDAKESREYLERVLNAAINLNH